MGDYYHNIPPRHSRRRSTNEGYDYQYRMRSHTPAYYPEDYQSGYFPPPSTAPQYAYPPSMQRRSLEPVPSVRENPPKERPCRVLFIRNIRFGVTEQQIRELFGQYGDIKNIYNLLENRGIAFLTFFDLRSAEKAKNALQNYEFNGRKIDVHFSLPKDGEVEKVSCDETKDQGTLLLTVKNPSKDISTKDVEQLMSAFGDVKCIRDYKKSINQKFIEFYDSRACITAHNELIGKSFNDGLIDLKYIWDYSAKFRQEDSLPAPPPRAYVPYNVDPYAYPPMDPYRHIPMDQYDQYDQYEQYTPQPEPHYRNSPINLPVHQEVHEPLPSPSKPKSFTNLLKAQMAGKILNDASFVPILCESSSSSDMLTAQMNELMALLSAPENQIQ